jgi:DNA-binding MarR family transcriptional regulator
VSDSLKPDDIDEVIHERVRLAIVAALAVAPELSFSELKEMLSLTDGNLSTHARTLEESGYISVQKTFQGRRPLTTMRLSSKGRKAFQRYLEMLRQIIAHGDQPRDAS